MRPRRGDCEPVPLAGDLAAARHHHARITQPHVRNGQPDRRPAGTRRRAVRAGILAGLRPAAAGGAAPDPVC